MKSVSSLFESCKKIVLAHKMVSGGVIAVVLICAYYMLPQADAMVTLQYGRARIGTVSEKVSGVGQVSATSQVDLKPKVNANVTQVLVGPGDKVTKGQVLFRLDARDAYKQVRDATLNLEQAKIALAKLKQPAESIDVITLEHAIEKVKTSKETQDTNVAIAYANLLSGGLQAVPDISYSLETPPTITGTYLKKEEGQIRVGIGQGTEGSVLSLSGIVNDTGRYSTTVAQPLGDTGLYIKFNSTQSSVNWIIDIPNKRSSSYLSLLNAYNTAKQNRDNAYADSDRQIAEYAQKLQDLKNGPKDIDLASSLLTVEQRQNALIDANATLSDYTIIAPFSGTMANVSAQVGLSAVTAASNGATSLGTIVTDKKIVEITLNETDIAKVHIGQLATVTFDALDGVSATGTVADIDGIGTVTQGVVTYKVKIYFDAPDVRIKPSMSVSVDIVTSSKEGVLVVPSSAVKRDTSGYYVESDGTSERDGGIRAATGTDMAVQAVRGIRASSTGATWSASTTRTRATSTTRGLGAGVTVSLATVFTKIPVTIGTKGDTMTEIVSGLKEGERIIIKKTSVSGKTATAAPSITSLFRPGAQGGQAGSARATGAATTRAQ